MDFNCSPGLFLMVYTLLASTASHGEYCSSAEVSAFLASPIQLDWLERPKMLGEKQGGQWVSDPFGHPNKTLLDRLQVLLDQPGGKKNPERVSSYIAKLDQIALEKNLQIDLTSQLNLSLSINALRY